MRAFLLTFLLILVTKYDVLFAQKQYRIKSVDFINNHTISNDELNSRLNSFQYKKLNHLFFWKKNPEFDPIVFKEDIVRLKKYYARNGFLNTEITYSIDTVRKHLKLSLLIKENEFITVDSVYYEGKFDSISHNIIDAFKSKTTLNPGKRFKDVDVFNTEKKLLQIFQNSGYPLAQTNFSIKPDVIKKKTKVLFNVQTGNRCYLGDIKITGDTLIPESFIRKRLLIAKSDLFNQAKIDKTQQKIFDTELFNYVIINTLKDSVSKNSIPVQIFVKELPRFSFEGGIGYGTEDRVRLSGQLTWLSFLGGARRLILNGKTSYYLPLGFDINFIQPDLFLDDLDLSLNPFFIREREESYEIDRLGGGIRFLFQINRKNRMTLSYTYEKDKLNIWYDDGIDQGDLKQDKSIISISNMYNNTNNNFYPSKGIKADASLSYAGINFGNNTKYYQWQLSCSKYSKLLENLILALRIKTGVIESIEKDKETPIEERFYAGGATSLRGWRRHDISPLSEDGFNIGGNTLFEASTELRFPIYDIFGGVIFSDAGNVWSNAYYYTLSSLHYNLGIGIRIKSPIGPIRLDMASPIGKDSFNFQFFISIGQAF